MFRIVRLAAMMILKSSAVLAFATVMSGCAANGNSAASLPSNRLVLAQSSCQNVVGIPRGDLAFDSCTQSLGSELSSAAASNSAMPVTDAVTANYFVIPASVQLHRRGQACESIGIHAGSSQFATCVTDLDSALMYARNKN